VKEHKRTEEQQKDFIFDTFSKCHSDPELDRIKAYQILCDQIYRWYRDYLKFDVDEAGLAIVQVVNHFLKEETILKIPQDKDGFFKYLNTSIKTDKADTYYEFNENDHVNIPKGKKRKLRKVEDFIRMKKSQLGRKLTNDEIIQGISEWFNISKKKAIEYLELINNKNVNGLDSKNNNGKERNILDTEDLKSAYLSSSYERPESTFFENFNVSIIKEAVISVLSKKQERARDCYKALFTLHCIENVKDKNFEELYPILDKNILETCKDGKNPNQYEIYQKYHPNAQKSSAEAMASKNLSEFLNDIETCLKENNL